MSDCLAKAGLQARVSSPSDADYEDCVNAYWSRCAKLKPSCVVRPGSAAEVSTALKALVGAGQQFAIKCGGHTPWKGSNSIQDGVIIDLCLLGQITYDEATQITTFGAGSRWNDVYRKLHEYRRVVVGGRSGEVGVSGVILGGGNTWMTARKGWACDNVLAFEVVLADGRIVMADKDTNEDLFKVLKGGSNNFGIVTKFTMGTLPLGDVWGGISVSPKTSIPDAIQLTENFTKTLSTHPDCNLITVLGYVPQIGDNVVSVGVVHTQGVEDDAAFESWRQLPKIVDNAKKRPIMDLSAEITLPSDYYTIWFTVNFKNDKRIMAKASEIHDRLVEDLKGRVADGDFATQCIFMPLPTLFAQASVVEAGGGNVLGFERNTNDGILQMAVQVRTAELFAFAHPRVKAWCADVKAFSETVEGGSIDWIYMNYADPSQDVLASYGPENVGRMRQAAAKYDPDQVFQRLCPGGFKISNVK